MGKKRGRKGEATSESRSGTMYGGRRVAKPPKGRRDVYAVANSSAADRADWVVMEAIQTVIAAHAEENYWAPYASEDEWYENEVEGPTDEWMSRWK